MTNIKLERDLNDIKLIINNNLLGESPIRIPTKKTSFDKLEDIALNRSIATDSVNYTAFVANLIKDRLE
jgi:hypothetical protein